MTPFISVIVPLLNEEATIERLTRSLLEQDYPRERFEILMVDGGSTDHTLEVLRRTDAEGRVRILSNPRRTAPAALNVALEAARGEIISRTDGHSFVAPDYLSRVVAVMEETGEAAVGGPVLMHADTPFRRALVEALNSKVGVGSVPYRTLRRRAFVESLQTGSFRRQVLEAAGGFDESLAVVEDLDMNTRIRKAGHRLVLDPSIRFWYVPRGTLGGLWRQIFSYGLVKARILRKHPDIFKVKYVLPSLFVAGAALAAALVLAGIASGLAGTAGGGGGWPAAAGALYLGAYAAVVLSFALSRAARLGAGCLRLLVIVPALHVGYGLGFWRGLMERRRRAPA